MGRTKMRSKHNSNFSVDIVSFQPNLTAENKNSVHPHNYFNLEEVDMPLALAYQKLAFGVQKIYVKQHLFILYMLLLLVKYKIRKKSFCLFV